MAPFLVGPPSIQTIEPTTTATTGNPFMDLMVTNFNSANSHPPLMGRTENNSATYLSTGNPCLDFFFHIVPDTPSESLINRLDLAWSYNPLTTLKLMCNLRGVRGTGKSNKNGFYTAALWLHKNHPKTLASNLQSFAQFGYFKDFPEILFRVMGLTRVPKMKSVVKSSRIFGSIRKSKQKKGKKATKSGKEARIKASVAMQEVEKQVAGQLRHSKKAEMAKTALERYTRDSDYRLLHDKVSDLFTEFLRSDLEFLNSGNLNKISLAAKWCPSLDSSFDRATLLCEAIARKLFPREKHEEYSGVEEAHYAYRVRDRLRKDVLVPLRRALELPEVFMSANRWNELPYNRVPSVAMKTYKEIFLKHDEERFNGFLEKVKSGEAKIAAGAVLPHEIISSLKDPDGGVVAELQWKRMVDDMLKEGKLNNCISVCDVSGSMSGTPMEVCIALGLLLSELCKNPWKGKVITFSENPELHLIEGNDLRSKTEFVRRMDWGMNTNFQKVFDLILGVAVQGKLAGDQMIKKVFVFSDMEFDQASSNPWETDYEVIKRKFKENGYGDYVPEMVFWNLRDSRATPVPKNQQGVGLVSGFSKNMMKLFLGGKQDELNPEAIMEAAIYGEEYSKLVILD
ncbi:uncharacterized protein LOC130810014 [Amaranthus tricolor]|uniref:uncharacterized protein LOC130810014 n=1 Tax=Amaranthus tricolor TaxID=29722 RepID=UPI002586819E|nr:uncharacterized protein LOC130810014 [Amaranthus tricolor]